MIEIKYIIGGVALAWVLINWIEYLKDWYSMLKPSKITCILDKYERYVYRDNLCLKCFSFWLVSIISFDILLGSIAGLLAYLLDAYVLKKKIEL